MALLFSRLDTKIAYGASCSIEIVGRTKKYSPAGKLFQNFQSAQIKHSYDYSHGVRSQADLQLVIDAFYIVMTGGYDGCLHKDWRDFIATQVNSNCAVIGGGATLQLQRVHSFGGQTYLRNITKPCASPAPQIYRTRAGSPSAIGSSTDSTTGIASITGHTAGDTYTWVGQFDVPVAFTDDMWVVDIETSSANQYLTSNAIKLEEIL